jgi:tetratricopeptide (TPR) repeat protein
MGFERQRRGKLDEAEKMLRRALEIRLKAFGPAKTIVAETSFTLAVILTEKGNYDEAKLLYNNALEVQELVLGPKTPQVARTLEHIANLLHKMNHAEEALAAAARAKLIRAELEYTVGVNVRAQRR